MGNPKLGVPQWGPILRVPYFRTSPYVVDDPIIAWCSNQNLELLRMLPLVSSVGFRV